jgi:hypothetical protein
LSFTVERKFPQQVGSELHISLAGAEYLVQAEVGLNRADRTAVAKIPGRPSLTNFPPLET